MEACSTIHDLRAAYRHNRATPEQVFRAAVQNARAAITCPDATNRHEWIHVASDGDVDVQLLALRNLDADLPLYGVPFAVKDNIDVAGVPTTLACPPHAYTPEQSAVVVRKLKAAGALLVGKTNLDQFATGLVGTRSPFGAVPSAWSDSLVSGGSSSGSAAAVARGVVAFSLGTDTAGSGRVPAAFNGVVGLKPSLGRVSNVGVFPACKSLDCASVFALTAADAAVVLGVMESAPEGNDVRYASPRPGPRRFGKSIRVGVPSAWPTIHSGVSTEDFRTRFDAVKEDWKARQGVELGEFDMKVLSDIGGELYGGPWVAERYSSFQTAIEKIPNAVDPTVLEIMKHGNRITGIESFEGLHRLEGRRVEANAIWEQVDVILVPSAPHHPTLEQVAADPVVVNKDLGSFTNFVNFLGWSALAMPVSSEHDTPFGVTWISKAGYDVALVELACRFANELGSRAVGAPSAGMKASPEALAFPSSLPVYEETMQLAVVGAHLEGMPLHHELITARALLNRATSTSAHYKLYALKTTPPKPALVRDSNGGQSIEVEVYDVPLTTVGNFLRGIPHPLGLGKMECKDGQWVTGFIAEPCATDDAEEVTKFGGWRRAMGRRTKYM